MFRFSAEQRGKNMKKIDCLVTFFRHRGVFPGWHAGVGQPRNLSKSQGHHSVETRTQTIPKKGFHKMYHHPNGCGSVGKAAIGW